MRKWWSSGPETHLDPTGSALLCSSLLGAAKSPKAKKGKAKAGSQRKGKRAQAKEEFEDLEADEDGVRGCRLMSEPSLASGERALSHAVPFCVQELGHENEEGINKRVVFILEELQTFLEEYTEMHQVLVASTWLARRCVWVPTAASTSRIYHRKRSATLWKCWLT